MFHILEHIYDNIICLDLPPYMGMYPIITVLYLKLFEALLLDYGIDDKMAVLYVDDLLLIKKSH